MLYSWSLNDSINGNDNEINPDVLGYIFEKYINQKAFGAYYTRPEITDYLCERTISKLILDRINQPAIKELNLAAIQFTMVRTVFKNTSSHTAKLTESFTKTVRSVEMPKSNFNEVKNAISN